MKTIPIVFVSASFASGNTARFVPEKMLIWPAMRSGTEPTCAVVIPVLMQRARNVASIAELPTEQRSRVEFAKPDVVGAANSPTFGARMAFVGP